MALDHTFQDQLPVLCTDLPYLNPEIPTMFPSPTSVLIPPPHNNPLLNHTNTFHHIQDNTLNMPTHNPDLFLEGLSSVSNPFNVPPIPCLGESSQAGSQSGFVNPNPMILSPNNKMESLYDHHSVLIPPPHNNPLLNHTNNFHHIQDNTLNMPTHNPDLLLEGLSSVSNPFNVLPIPCFGDSSLAGSQSGFVNPNPMILSPNNKMESLYDHQGGTFIWDFEQKDAIQSTAASASANVQMGPLIFSQPPPPVDSREIELVKKALYERDLSYLNEIFSTNHDGEQGKTVQAEGDINTANITTGHWSKQEDKDLVELVKQYGESQWSKVAKLMKKRLGRQCRERWHNHLRPEIKKHPWTIIEDLILIKSHQELGNKWEEIAKRLPGRSGNTIMNRWNATKRCQNIIKKDKKTPGTSDGSMLQAYIKKVTASKEATRKTKETINRMKMKEAMHTKLNNGCNNLTPLVKNHLVVNGKVNGIASGSVMDGSTMYGSILEGLI